jgi:hypothetical protein
MDYGGAPLVDRGHGAARTGRWWRTAPGFSQRLTLTRAPDGNTLHGVSELSKDDVTWEQDLELTYTRAR